MSQFHPKAVVIGTSAGAVEALSCILPALPQNFSLPIMIVVHQPQDKNSILAPVLQSKCLLNVKEAEDKESIHGGTIYLAPPDYHLLIEPTHRLSLSSEEPVHFSRPSIDVLFESAADVYGPTLIGMVLTGASCDGARGLAAIARQGGVPLVQTPESAYASTMPTEALRACLIAKPRGLKEMASYLQEVASSP